MKKSQSLIVLMFLFSLPAFAQVGIGTTLPNSTLDVRGSFSLNNRSFNTSTTASFTDHSLIFTGSSAAVLTLPDATTCSGRMYWIKNASNTMPTPALTVATVSGQTIDANSSWFLNEARQMVTILSNGTNWHVVSSNPNIRTNYVLVKSASDFPAPVGGIISLNPGWLYEINGIISLSSKINLNDAEIKGGAGLGGEEDGLIYTGTAELFTGSKGGTITNLKLSSIASGSKLFNINAMGTDEDLVIQNCFIDDNDNLGMLQGFGGEILFENIDLDDNMNGIIFQNDSCVILTGMYWNANNHNTFEKFIGTFQSIQKLGGISRSLSANTAIAFDVSGITAITSGASIKSTLFDGNGTYVVGTFSKQWEVESYGLTTEKDDVSTGNLYVSASALTTIATVNSPVKIAGSTSAVNLFRVTSPANNRLMYAGTKSRKFQVICSLTAIQSSNNIQYAFYIVKNGIIMPESKQFRKFGNSSEQQSVTLSCTVSLSTNDYIEVWVENLTNTTPITVETLNLAIK